MGKLGEMEYFQKLDPYSLRHALEKPFSDPDCGRYLMEVGTVFALLPPAPARLLDLGCGSGWTSCFFARRGYDVVGQDIAADAVALAGRKKEELGLDRLHFVVSDYE